MSQFFLDSVFWHLSGIILLSSSPEKNFDNSLSDFLVANQDGDGGQESVGCSETEFEENIKHDADILKNDLTNDHVDWIGHHKDNSHASDAKEIAVEVFVLISSSWFADHVTQDRHGGEQGPENQRDGKSDEDWNYSWKLHPSNQMDVSNVIIHLSIFYPLSVKCDNFPW